MTPIGLIRFSMYSEQNFGSWAASRGKDTRAYRDELFSEVRLKKRLSIFEAVTLPSLDAQTRDNFLIFIMISDLLPQPFIDRLNTLSNGRKYLKVVSFPPSVSVAQAGREIIKNIHVKSCVSFRLDDDDALAENFIQRLADESAVASDGEIIFSGLTTAKKMTNEKNMISNSYNTKKECEQNLKDLKGNKNLKRVDSFNLEKSYIITDYKPLANNERIVVNAFQCSGIPS